MKNNNFQIGGRFKPSMDSVTRIEHCTRHLISIFLLLSTLSPYNLSAQGVIEDEILKAYELRISGKSDDAKSILESVLEKDSTNAMANFEMGRTALANIEKDRTIAENQIQYFNRATRYDPDNAMYAYYKADIYMLRAFIAMMEGNKEPAIKNVGMSCEALKKVLEINSNCKETLLFLVDIYGTLPEEEGGNKKEAMEYLKLLQKIDPVYAAQGELILEAEEVNPVDFWHEYIDKNGADNEVFIKLGKAYLMNDSIEKAEKYFKKVLAKDPAQNQLYLQLARAYMYRTMRGASPLDQTAPLIKEYFSLYLENEKNKPSSVEAWCYWHLSVVEEKQGNIEQAKYYLAKANEINPEFSRATALPEVDQPPNVIAYHFSSYFSPF